MKRSRIVLGSLFGAAALVALVFAGALTALNSELFARWLLAEIAARSDGALHVESVSGTLDDGLDIGTLAVEFESGTATARSVAFVLDWRSLIARSFVLDYLQIDRLEVQYTPSASAGEAAQPMDLSTLVLIREITVAEVAVAINDAMYSAQDVEAALRLLRNHLELTSLSVRYDEATYTGETALTFADEISFQADICIDGVLQNERVVGCVEAQGTQESVRLNARTELPFPATATGVIEPTAPGFVDLALTWQDAALVSVPDFSSARGTAQITGEWQRLRVVAEGAARYQEEAAEFDTSLVFTPDALEVARLRLDQSPAIVEAAGTVASDFSGAEFALTVRNADPQRWLAGWPGDLDVRAQVAISLQPELSVDAQDVVLNGDLRNYPLAATGALGWSAAGLRLDALQIVSRSDRVTVSGLLGDRLDVDLVAAMADIGAAVPEAAGSLNAELEISGSLERPRGSGMVELENFVMAGVSARALQISGVAGISQDDPVELALSAIDLDVRGTYISQSIASLTGTAATHRLEARATGEGWTGNVAGEGALIEEVWNGTVDRFEFAPGEFGQWRLMRPTEVTYGVGAYSVDDLCLSYTLSRVCAAVSVSGTSEDSLRVETQNFDIGILAPFLPEQVRAKGLVDARAELTNFIADPRGEVELEVADAQVDIALAEEVFLPVPVEQFSLGALFDESGATLSLNLNAAETGNATIALAVLGNPVVAESRLEGTVNLEWHDAAALALLSPDVEDVTGRMAATLTLGGTIGEPVIGGSADWSGGSLTVPAWALFVDDIAASIDSGAGEEATFRATGSVDGTPVTIDGTVLLDPLEGWPMQLRLNAENVSLVQLAGLEIVVSPQLEANVRLPLVEVEGSVFIPTAHISDVTLPQQAVVPSTDAVVHGRTSDAPARTIDVVASLTLVLGDDITFVDTNLDAAVTGRLDLDYRSGVGAAAEGQLTVSGVYNAYGNPLALERGQLIFIGPLDDPSLDIRAVREIGEVTVGAQLTGTLKAPVTTLFSDPPMTEAETLSWLLFGQPLELAREEESRVLRNAALSMGLQQALPVITRIGETLGFDDFAIRTSETDVSALMAGKHLSPNLYFQYSYGLFNRIGGLLLRYRINERFSLETRSGEHNSMDLLYTVEKE